MIVPMEAFVMMMYALREPRDVEILMVVNLMKYVKMAIVYLNAKMTMNVQMETLVMVVDAYQEKNNVKAQTNVLVAKYAKMESV